VEKDNLPARLAERLMFESDNVDARGDGVFHTPGGEALEIDFTRPEVSRDGKQVRIPEERLEGWGQTSILAAGQKSGPGVLEPGPQ